MSLDKPNPETDQFQVKDIKSKPKHKDLFVVFIAIFVMITVGCIAYVNWIQENIISTKEMTIQNMQKQLSITGSFFHKINPKITIEKYLKEQKMKKEQNFIFVIEKLQPKLSPTISRMISNSLLLECEKKNIDENLILSLIYTESSIDPMKESNMGACGLMQVRYKVWKQEPELKDNGVDKWHKLFWVEENIKAGTDIFKKFYSESGNNINVTLYRYNSGSTKIPEKPNEEVLKYINKIMYYHYYIQNIVRGNDETSKGFNR